MPGVFLTDFGLARDTTTGSRFTRTGTTLGTPAYMSPELARGEIHALTPASDVWALGCVLYECLTAHRAFAGDTPAAVIGAILTTTPPPPSGLPPGVTGLVQVCLQRRAHTRYPTAGALRQDLQRCLDGLRPCVRPPRHTRAWAAAALIGLGALAAGGWWLRPGRGAPRAPEASAAQQDAQAGWRLRGSDLARAARLLAQACAAEPARHDWRLQLGTLRWAVQGEDAAIAEWAQVPDDAPEATRAWWLRGLAATAQQLGTFQHGRTVAGRAAWQRAATGHGVEAAWARAGLAMIDHRFAEVRAAVDGAGQWDAALLLALAEGSSRNPSGDPVRALAGYDRALSQGVPLLWALLNRANLHVAAGHHADALADLQQAGALRPDHFALLVNRASIYRRLGDTARADADVARCLRLHPERGEAWANRALARIAAGDLDGALADADAALARAPELPEARCVRGRVLLRRGQAAPAVAEFDRALAVDPDYVAAHAFRGRAFQALGRDADALADYDAAVACDPGFTAGYSTRGNLHLEHGDVAAALADFDRALALDPDDARVRYNRANARLQSGDRAGALADYTGAIERDPALAVAWLGRADLLEANGDRAAALADLDQAVAHCPSDAVAWLNRGVCRLRGGDRAGGSADLDHAIALGPDLPRSWFNRGLLRLQTGNAAAAADDLEHAVALDATLAEAQLALGTAYVYQERWAPAAAAYRRFLALAPEHPQAAVTRQSIAYCEAQLAQGR